MHNLPIMLSAIFTEFCKNLGSLNLLYILFAKHGQRVALIEINYSFGFQRWRYTANKNNNKSKLD